MLVDDGLNRIHPSQFQSIVVGKFTVSLINGFLLILIWITINNNIYYDQPLNEDKDKIKQSKSEMTICLSLFAVFAIIDFLIVITGLTYAFNKCNIIVLLMKCLEAIMLLHFYLDTWKDVILWYILFFLQFECTVIEVCAVISSYFFQFKKYNRIRANEINYIDKPKHH